MEGLGVTNALRLEAFVLVKLNLIFRCSKTSLGSMIWRYQNLYQSKKSNREKSMSGKSNHDRFMSNHDVSAALLTDKSISAFIDM